MSQQESQGKSEGPVELVTEGGVATIWLSRPEALNALDSETMDQLYEAAVKAGSKDSIRVIVLRGRGKAFCAGGDIKKLLSQAFSDPSLGPLELARLGADKLHRVIQVLRRAPKPVISLVHGACAGAGVGLALCGDIVWAAKNASFTLAYTSIGLSPDGGTTYFLTRQVGEKMAMELLLTSRPVSSEEALRIGLVSRVLDDDQAEVELGKLIEKLASGPTRAYAEVKRLVSDSLREGLESHLDKETQGILKTIVSKDFMEGVQAFMEKRAPKFRNA